jgi:hypothetical protein
VAIITCDSHKGKIIIGHAHKTVINAVLEENAQGRHGRLLQKK